MFKTAITLIAFCLLASSCNVGDVAGWAGLNKNKKSSSDSTWANLLEPPMMKVCYDQGRIYNRDKDSCHVARLAPYECTAYNATQAFRNYASKVAFRFSMLMALGWQFDQCGTYDGKPIVFMTRKSSDGEVALEVLELKPGLNFSSTGGS